MDWARVDATTDADIEHQIASDPDTAPVLGEDYFRHAAIVVPPERVDVRAIRQRLGLSQRAFAERYGFSIRTVQQWEQGRAEPERSARILLKMIETAPEL